MFSFPFCEMKIMQHKNKMKSVNLKQSVCPSLSQSPYSPSLSHKLAGPIEHPSKQPFFANLIVYQKSAYNSPLWSKRKPFTSNTCTWSSLAGITFAPQTKLVHEWTRQNYIVSYPIQVLHSKPTTESWGFIRVYPCTHLHLGVWRCSPFLGLSLLKKKTGSV